MFFSEPVIISNYFVEGALGLPSDVENFNMNILGDTAHLSWDAVKDIDLKHYEIKFSPKINGANWGNTIGLLPSVSKTTTSISLPVMVGSYLIKAVDIGGRKSESETIITSTIRELSHLNVVSCLEEAPEFLGVKTSIGITDGGLCLSGVDSVDDWSSFDAVSDITVGENSLVNFGQYEFLDAFDLGAVYTSTLTAVLNVVGIDLTDNIDAWDAIDNVESWDSTVDASQWLTQLQLRTTEDDPLGAPVWSEWKIFFIGDYTARAFQFRLTLKSFETGITPLVSGLSVKVDMPDRVVGLEDITSDALGSVVSFANAFKETPAVAISAQNMESGDFYTITSSSTDGQIISEADEVTKGLVERATDAEVIAGTDTTRYITSKQLADSVGDGAITQDTSLSTASGATKSFTGISAEVKRIQIILSGVSTSSATNIKLRLGGSGGLESTGYACSASGASSGNVANGTSSTTEFLLLNSALNNVSKKFSGTVTLMRLAAGSDTWVMSGAINGEDRPEKAAAMQIVRENIKAEYPKP